jgi:4-hydroxy-2-oxoheptanedioate aldolase
VYKTETLLFEQLKLLKDKYNLQGVKAEFEAEGSSYRDVNRLKRICLQLGIEVHLKIGGVEAVRDIKDALELGVDGLIAPMVESKFAAKKFIDAYQKIYKDTQIHTSLNIETRSGINNLEKIIEISSGVVDNITIGRSDLSSSFFNNDLTPDSDYIFELIEDIAPIILVSGMTITIGGGVTQQTIDKIKNNFPSLKSMISKIETRKAMFNTQDLMNLTNSINSALRFEELYILSKKEFVDMTIDSEISRLPELSRRIKT